MKKIIFALCLFASFFAKSQVGTFTISITKGASACEKGWAKLIISGGSVVSNTVNWSNGLVGNYQNTLDSGLYSVTVADSLGNDTVVQIYIEAKECPIHVSASFTPNGDGTHDTWGASNTKYHEGEYIIQVFNRWGQKVFEAKNEFEPWDGRSFGSPVPDGTYYYIIEYTDSNFGEKKAHGTVTILR
ncbi:MAG: gliding motility-associated C-terminal domain-containing protein [Bacteroidia bacterium]|nr:gliding motility-associated C-terminal domain-containing protein [Bacteroidia bacterium]